MKTKLLKRVRRDFCIFEYEAPFEKAYQVEDDTSAAYEPGYTREDWFDTLQEAKDEILYRVKSRYYKHSKAYKLSQVKTKVWHSKH